MSGENPAARTWGRGDTVLFALSAGTLVLLAVQFALAGFGAFTMLNNRSDNAYQALAVSPPAGCLPVQTPPGSACRAEKPRSEPRYRGCRR